LELVSADYMTIEDLQQKGKIRNILVVIDHFTRYTMAFVTPDQKATTTARVLWDRVFMVLGLPHRLLSDQGKSFENELIQELCQLARVRKIRTTPYHPQGNGKVERVNRTIRDMLGRLGEEDKMRWYNQLPTVLYAYNATRSQITGYSPHFLMFGRRPRLPIDYDFPTMLLEKSRVTRPAYIREVESCLQAAYEVVDELNKKEMHRQKRYYDKKCRAAVLKPGDLVLTRQDHREGRKKLSDRWSSKIHRVLDQMGTDSPVYQVEDIETNRTRCLHRNKLLIVQMAKTEQDEEEPRTHAGEQASEALQARDGRVTPAPDPAKTGVSVSSANEAPP
jgi:hypothetical protein